MGKQLLIQFTEAELQADTVVAWLLLEDGQTGGNVIQGTLADAARYADNARVIVSVPAEVIYLTRQHLPGKNRQRLLKAIPFALEDQIIDDIEDMHFALGTADPQGQYWVAAVRRQQMETWRSQLALVGLNPKVIIPDVMLLPGTTGELCLLTDAGRTLLVSPDGERWVMDSANIGLALKKIMLNKEFPVIHVRSYSTGPETELESLLASQLNCDISVQVILPLRLLATGVTENLPLNLLQGSYSHREKRRHQQYRVWYPVAAMLAVWIVVRLGLAVVDNIHLSNQLDAIRQQQQQVYRQAFPTAKPGGDVYRKMEARLKELKQKRGAADASFYAMLQKLAPILADSLGLQVQVLRYHDGRVDLEVQLPTLQSLDQLKSSLSKQQHWQVEIQSASSDKNHVEARLQIRSQT